MSRRRDLDLKLHGLLEIREILDSMKNLAVMELRRLDRFAGAQRQAVATIAEAAADFARFFPEFCAGAAGGSVTLVLGSERGFCGDFNETLLRRVPPGATAVLVGSRLAGKAEPHRPVAATLPSASVVEEVEPTLVRIVNALGEAAGGSLGPLLVSVIHHSPPHGQVGVSLLHPFTEPVSPNRYSSPPLLYLEPAVLAKELTEQYLLARLHQLLYDSLTAENHARVAHMEAAVRQLDERCVELKKRGQSLRQEEITQEIEVIMLGAELVRPTSVSTSAN
ncbi:MAG: F0F1 ATP synthase subunit gamma [Bryobacteraceae bacterium]